MGWDFFISWPQSVCGAANIVNYSFYSQAHIGIQKLKEKSGQLFIIKSKENTLLCCVCNFVLKCYNLVQFS